MQGSSEKSRGRLWRGEISCDEFSRAFNSTGFTLVELLVVIGVIAILVSLLLPALNKARQQAQAVQCMARMRELNNACLLYAANNNAYLPPMMFAADTSSHYLWPSLYPSGGGNTGRTCYLTTYFGNESSKVYVCPALADNIPDTPLSQGATGYYSYSCNMYLFGIPWSGGLSSLPKYTGPSNAGANVTGTQGILRPWKISQIHQSTLMATFIDANQNDYYNATGRPGVRSAPGNAMDNFWFRQEPGISSTTGGWNYHMPSPVDGINGNGAPNVVYHTMQKRQGSYTNAGIVVPAYVGNLNVAFADGSVRSVWFPLTQAWVAGPVKTEPGLGGQLYVVPDRPQPRW